MIKVSILYPNGDGATFDADYYLQRHLPMVAGFTGDALKDRGVELGLAGGAPDEPATYIAMGYLVFDSVEAFQASFGPHADRAMADIPNYTNTTPVLQISEMRE